jgi:hypothetical protein
MPALTFEITQQFLDDRGQRSGFILLGSFLAAFVFIRTSARLIRSPKVPWWPGSATTKGGLHVHHLVWGIVLILVSGFLNFVLEPGSPWVEVFAAVFAMGAVALPTRWAADGALPGSVRASARAAAAARERDRRCAQPAGTSRADAEIELMVEQSWRRDRRVQACAAGEASGTAWRYAAVKWRWSQPISSRTAPRGFPVAECRFEKLAGLEPAPKRDARFSRSGQAPIPSARMSCSGEALSIPGIGRSTRPWWGSRDESSGADGSIGIEKEPAATAAPTEEAR